MKTRRNPVVALFLSLFFDGLGQLYNGDLLTAMFVVGGSTLVYIFIGAAYGFAFIGYEPMELVVFAWTIAYKSVVVIHAAIRARRQQDYRLKTYNSLIYYVSFVALVIAINMGFQGFEHSVLLWPFSVPNTAMTTSAPKGSCVVVKPSLGQHPKIHDIVVWQNKGTYYVSRVTGTPGMTTPVALDQDHYYVEAEVAGHIDSNTVGPISKSDIVGISGDVIWPYFSEGWLASFKPLRCLGRKFVPEKSR